LRGDGGHGLYWPPLNLSRPIVIYYKFNSSFKSNIIFRMIREEQKSSF
jgi:hypothetical protein